MNDAVIMAAAARLQKDVVEAAREAGYWIGRHPKTGEDLIATHESRLAAYAALSSNANGVHVAVGGGTSGRLVDPTFTPPVLYDDKDDVFRGGTRDGRDAVTVVLDAIKEAMGPPQPK